MRSRLLPIVVVTGLAVAAPSASAETGKGALRVSATVVRSCRVASDAPSVRVDCGTRRYLLQIVSASQRPAPGATPAQATQSITIEF